MPVARSILVAVCVTLATGALAVIRAQQAPQTPVFRTDVELIRLDVSVVGRDRMPLRGLSAADFTLLEDGTPQKVEAFSAVDLPDVETTTTGEATWTRMVAPDVTSNQLSNKRLFVMVLDDATAQADVAALQSAKRIAKSVIEKLAPSDLMAIVFARDNRNARDFTSDRARLLAAVDTFGVGFRDMARPVPGGPSMPNTDVLYYGFSVNTLENVTEYLIAAPDQRKTLIYVGQGVPVDFESSAPVMIGGRGSLADREAQQALIAAMPRIFRKAQLANVNVYAIDTCGLRVAGKLPPTCVPGLEVEYLQTVTANTGGHATINTNDFEPGITQIFRENGSYYLLGFRSTNTKSDGKFRRLDVKVNRPDVTVRVRNGYHARDAEAEAKAAKKPAPPPLLKAMSGVLPDGGLPMRAAVAPFAVPGEQTVAVAVTIGVQQPPLGTRAGESVTLVTRAFSPEGAARGSREDTVTLNLSPARRGDEFTRYELLSKLELKPGRYELRMSAQSTAFDKRGSVYAEVEVPDFAKLPLSMSGVVLSATPGVPSAPSGAVEALVPVIPTTAREFVRFERVTSFLRVYQGGKARLAPVAATIRIHDVRDQAVVEETRPLNVEAFGSARAADVKFDLPLARLQPGQYVLSFEATLEKVTARRDVRFSVR